MAVSMASSGCTLGLYPNLKAIEKQPIAKASLFTCSFRSDPVQGFYIFSKKRFLLICAILLFVIHNWGSLIGFG